MSEGGWIAVGAAIGLLGSVVTTLLNAWVSRWSKYPKYERAANQLLLAMLQHSDWRSIRTLSRVVGMNESDTKEYLIGIGARGSETNGEMWGLISKNPIKAIDARTVRD